jgi:endonuclease YncB( thermonuclease family)
MFNSCFKPKNSVPLLIEKNNRNIDDVCVKITDEPFTQKTLGLLDTKSLYDSCEWLNKLDKNIDWKDTIQFIPPIEKGVVIKVYDGDTITIASKLPYTSSPLYRFSVRLNGIDCPEIKGKDENEKQCAQIAKEEMSNLILNKIVTLKNIRTEKYGRILADVYIDELHLNNHLIQKRLAVVYDGGIKISPKNWMEYYLKG